MIDIGKSPEATLGLLAGIGAGIGLGQLLLSKDKLTWRVAIGRAICSGALSLSAGIILIIYPDTPVLALLGGGATLASLGTTGLELIVQRVLNR